MSAILPHLETTPRRPDWFEPPHGGIKIGYFVLFLNDFMPSCRVYVATYPKRGLIPGWWKKTAKEVPSTFNARAETVAQKPMFRSAFKRARCTVPASDYYEWPAWGRQAALFHQRGGWPVLSIADLWDEWRDPETRESVLSCTLIVTSANDFTRPIHDRMPVLLGRQDHDAWLTGKAGVELLRPAPNDLLRMWPVSKRVNVSGRGDDDPSLIECVGDDAIADS
jgi:putative SOS response-associated peptidase YedK